MRELEELGYMFEWDNMGDYAIILRVKDDMGRHVKSYLRSSPAMCELAVVEDRRLGRL